MAKQFPLGHTFFIFGKMTIPCAVPHEAMIALRLYGTGREHSTRPGETLWGNE
ncbi:hypothetical protein [Faecalispora sporosphaeroides]|uniref:hypothetical protein n=1 Tax=Faecalispora sporosphaeroides TaxID=1549 RepID=UPI00036B2DF4|nr:hypothetical protein [Faecalispora sporosphaeroides]